LIKEEPLWPKASVIQNGKTVPLVIEVVSTNSRDDYGHKLVEYETMGIAEYWIVDYRALGAVRYIGKPKQPTITVCQLMEGEYQMQRFIAGQPVQSVRCTRLQKNFPKARLWGIQSGKLRVREMVI